MEQESWIKGRVPRLTGSAAAAPDPLVPSCTPKPFHGAENTRNSASDMTSDGGGITIPRRMYCGNRPKIMSGFFCEIYE